MSNTGLAIKDINSFTLEELKRYLRFFGFLKGNEGKNSIEYTKYIKEYDELVSLPVPKKREIKNYYESLYNIIAVISSITKKAKQEIISDIVSVSNDLMRMRISNNSEWYRSIPLDMAAREVEALKQLLIYGASSEERPRPFFEKPTKIGSDHANQCQFGHTFEGSFGFSICSPLVDDYTQITFEEEEIDKPFERKVIERIANGLLLTRQATSEQNIDYIVDNFETGFNSRMCDAIVEMSNDDSNLVHFEIAWSPQIQVSKELKTLGECVLKPNAIDVLKSASIQLKTVEPFDDTIIGRIITLHSNKSPFTEELFPRVAIIKHYYENKTIDVRMELNMEQYKKAYTAHGNGETIEAKGKLYRKGNTWRLIDVSSFEIYHK